jgi:hypothetical protein
MPALPDLLIADNCSPDEGRPKPINLLATYPEPHSGYDGMLSAMSVLFTHEIAQFRPRRQGPESIIQQTVEKRVDSFITPTSAGVWTAAELPLGAGVPDLIVAAYHHDVLALANVDISHSEILAYLRIVGRARLETIAERLQMPEKTTQKRLEALLDARVLSVSDEVFILPPLWREILPEIVTIEVKVSDWRRAVEQAARNRIFAHRSYVALPQRTAERVRMEPLFAQLGLGLVGVTEEKEVHIVRRPRRRQPVVWTYYYKLASVLARSFTN